MGYSYRLTARVLLYAPSHRQDCTYHGLCYTSCGTLAGTRNSSMGPPHEGSIRRPTAPLGVNILVMPIILYLYAARFTLWPKEKIKRERERNVLFNYALNTFYLRLYGIRHMVKDHSDSEKGNLPHRLLLSINSKGSFICTIHRQDNTYHSLCYTSHGALAGTRNSSI